MVGFIREFFKTGFFELEAKLKRRRLRRELELYEIERKVGERNRDIRQRAINAELELRKREAAIAKHNIPENPYGS